jgi:serine/threonine-protein kinase
MSEPHASHSSHSSHSSHARADGAATARVVTCAPSHPERIGRYEILARLASGAMGVVYLARAQGMGGFERRVAIKVLHAHLAQKPHIVSMLLTEARLAAQIQHPNAVSVLDVDVTAAGEHYVVMDYVDGFTLCELLDHPRLDAVRRVRLGLRILLDATQGLEAAHRLCHPGDGSPLGIVHRDVSPSNILCGLQGTGFITDFGIARVAAEDADSMPGVIKGTPCYMAPEQVAGSSQLNARADVWSLGAVLWEVLTGEQLFFSPHGIGGVLSMVLTGHVPPPSSLNSRVPEALDALCGRALRRDPEERIGSARELAEGLERIAREHDLIASAHETADAMCELFAESLAKRRSWFPPAVAAAPPAEAARSSVVAAPNGTTSTARGAATGAGSGVATETEIARLRQRRPPWLPIAIATLTLAAAAALFLLDASSSRRKLGGPAATAGAEQPRATPARPWYLFHWPEAADATDEREATDARPGREGRPAARHLGFAPARVPGPSVPGRARDGDGDGPVELEPNPYLQR